MHKESTWIAWQSRLGFFSVSKKKSPASGEMAFSDLCMDKTQENEDCDNVLDLDTSFVALSCSSEIKGKTNKPL